MDVKHTTIHPQLPKPGEPVRSQKKEPEAEHLGGTETLVRPSDDVREPPLFRIIILNDDFTPKDFVVHILKKFFNKNEVEANNLMMQVHTKGRGVVGVYTFEIAETKTYQVNSYSKQNQYPLKTIMEEN